MDKKIKKMIAFGLALIMLVSVLSSCGKSSNDNESGRIITGDNVIYEVNVRQYTKEGTFDAFGEHLQELKDMGVTILWFMPVHPISLKNRSGKLGSYYSITDYREINPEFGTKEDFKELVDAAHDMGFKVMMDWVANHTGWDCEWIKAHPEWYTQDESGNIISPAGMGWPDVADLNYDNMDMRKEMISCMKYWVDEYDVDGFRCDYANGVPLEFWEAAREEIEKSKPVIMLAEDDKYKEYLEKAFDMNYNWGLYDLLIGIARGGKQPSSIKAYLPANYPEGTFKLNFLDNHDKNSYEHTILEGYGAEALPAMFSLIYTVPGIPLIYSGDEIAYDKNIEFMDRDPIAWNSSEYDFRDLLTGLAEIRSDNKALCAGSENMTYIDVQNKKIFAFEREIDGNKVVCVFNLSKNEQSGNSVFDGTEKILASGNAGSYDLNDEYSASVENGQMVLKPWEFVIMNK